jgi:hypothetical protein
MWAQWDWGQGPRIADRVTNLFCAWLAWARHRVIIPTWDRTLPTLIGCLDRAMRAWGGAPTYWLTDNERTVTVDHVAGIAVRHPPIVQVGHHFNHCAVLRLSGDHDAGVVVQGVVVGEHVDRDRFVDLRLGRVVDGDNRL